MRNALIVTNTIGLVGYVLLPTAPPRLIPGVGIVDTLAQAEVINHDSNLVQLASNPYAAMPSLHAADAAIIGVALAQVVQPRPLKLAFVLWPAWVSFSLIASGNHFLLDIAAGLLLAALGAWVAGRLTRRRSTPVDSSFEPRQTMSSASIRSRCSSPSASDTAPSTRSTACGCSARPTGNRRLAPIFNEA